MPARPSRVPAYCLHKPSGRAYVRIRGKVIYVGEYGSADSKQEYGRLIAELAANSGSAVYSAVPGLTVVEVAEAYWQFAKGVLPQQGWRPERLVDSHPPCAPQALSDTLRSNPRHRLRAQSV